MGRRVCNQHVHMHIEQAELAQRSEAAQAYVGKLEARVEALQNELDMERLERRRLQVSRLCWGDGRSGVVVSGCAHVRCMHACIGLTAIAYTQEENAAVSAQQGAKAEEAEALARKL